VEKERIKRVRDQAFVASRELLEIFPALLPIVTDCVRQDIEARLSRNILKISKMMATDIFALIYDAYPELEDELKKELKKYGKIQQSAI